MAYPDDNTKPKKLRVLEALQSVVGAVNPGNGYKHEIRAAHLYDRGEIVLGGQFPCAVVAPSGTDRHNTRLSCGFSEHRLDVSIAVLSRVMTGSSKYKEDMHWLCADVIKAIEDNIQLGGEAVFCEVTADQVYDLGEGETVAAAEVNVAIKYRHAIGNPSL